MTDREYKQAVEMLKDRTDRVSHMSDGRGGSILTAYWLDGGQKIFYSLDDVQHWLDVKNGVKAC